MIDDEYLRDPREKATGGVVRHPIHLIGETGCTMYADPADHVREICAREGHNPIDISTQGDGFLRRSMCRRGCGIYICELRLGVKVDVDWVIGKLTDPIDKVTVTRLEFTLEPEEDEE